MSTSQRLLEAASIVFPLAWTRTGRLKLRSSRGSTDKPINFRDSTSPPRVSATVATAAQCLVAVLRLTANWIARSLQELLAISQPDPCCLPSFNARYSFTMIKAIFYSKFDTQEGKTSKEPLTISTISDVRFQVQKSSTKSPTEPSSPPPPLQDSHSSSPSPTSHSS